MNQFLSIALCITGLTLAVAAAAHTLTPRVSPPALSQDVVAQDAVTQDAAVQDATSDAITHPEEVKTLTAGPYQFTLTAADDWQTPTAIGELSREGTQLWQQTLPHQYGPKFALVTPAGQTILFDEYINVASDHAITLINSSGETISIHSFDDIHKAIQQALPETVRADLTRQATTGWWISAPPTLDSANEYALVKTAGTTLVIDLSTGELSLSPS